MTSVISKLEWWILKNLGSEKVIYSSVYVLLLGRIATLKMTFNVFSVFKLSKWYLELSTSQMIFSSVDQINILYTSMVLSAIK